FSLTPPQPPLPTLFPYTTLFRSPARRTAEVSCARAVSSAARAARDRSRSVPRGRAAPTSRARLRCRAARSALPVRIAARPDRERSEEHTSELQSRENLVCRLLLE